MQLAGKQRGVALGGLIVWCIIIGLGAIIAMRFWPLYNQKMKVDLAMKNIAESEGIARMTKDDIYKAILRNFEVQDVDQFDRQSIRKVLTIEKAKDSNDRIATMAYEIRGPLFAKFDVVMNYSNSKTLPPLDY